MSSIEDSIKNIEAAITALKENLASQGIIKSPFFIVRFLTRREALWASSKG